MSQPRILIIDDDEHTRETMGFALGAAGYQTDAAADGPEGLAKFGNGEDWSLVLLDQRMPGMEGLELLRRLRTVNPAVPIILLTAYGTIGLAQGVLGSGASAFLRKPVTPEELRGVVRDVLVAHTRASGQEGTV